MSDKQSLLRQLPSVNQLIESEKGTSLIAQFGRDNVVDTLRQTLEHTRQAILAGELNNGQTAALPDHILRATAASLKSALAPTLFPVINTTGVIIHTNLGRAPLSEAAQAAVASVANRYNTLEFDIESGKRGSRAIHAEELLRRVTGAEAALVVNNTASAVFMILSALTRGREVIISRGQLVEIGGGFRIPDVMAQSGAKLVEVGTTNRTRLSDYESAITENTAAIMVAHQSNYRVIGFTEEPELAGLAALAHAHDLPLFYDQGSGALLDTSLYGLLPEPTVQAGVAAGCDLVAFSGDKLLGGPQAGIICGRADLIGRLKKHPLARALRADKMGLAALSATLTHFAKGEAEQEIPIWRMMARSAESVAQEAQRWVDDLTQAGVQAQIVDGFSTVGGGSLPGTQLASKIVAITHANAETLSADLRNSDPPIIGRIQDDLLLLDPRTVFEDQVEPLLAAVKKHAASK